MQVPEEFKAFVSLFDLDLHDRTPDERELIAFALKHTPDADKQIVKAYLDKLLGGDYGDAELLKIWLDAGPALSVPNQSELRQLLQMVRQAMS
ncbi:MAG: hypothetical protein F9K29_24050 [Hyphomicrobiaceae bacterium]|nr:MAG: hypothetical protein F9K29_24050 [Hyphomicrobiaceae bacterium]